MEDYTVIISGGRDVAENAEEETLSVVNVSPNPVTSVARLNYTLVKTGTVTFNLRDANGVQRRVVPINMGNVLRCWVRKFSLLAKVVES